MRRSESFWLGVMPWPFCVPSQKITNSFTYIYLSVPIVRTCGQQHHSGVVKYADKQQDSIIARVEIAAPHVTGVPLHTKKVTHSRRSSAGKSRSFGTIISAQKSRFGSNHFWYSETSSRLSYSTLCVMAMLCAGKWWGKKRSRSAMWHKTQKRGGGRLRRKLKLVVVGARTRCLTRRNCVK